jgi:3-isopropylmalate/(R)-2-methylmalate dehydratase small subunit
VEMQLHGNAWCFGGLLDVDWEICPRRVKEELRQLRGGEPSDEDFGPYCMSMVDPTFAERVQQGDFLVGEEGFGYGHDHHHACQSIKGCGVGAVLCNSSTTYFLRNSLNLGLLVLEVPGIFAATSTGDAIHIDLENGTVTNATTSWQAEFTKLPDFLLEILAAGGVNNLLGKDR